MPTLTNDSKQRWNDRFISSPPLTHLLTAQRVHNKARVRISLGLVFINTVVIQAATVDSPQSSPPLSIIIDFKLTARSLLIARRRLRSRRTNSSSLIPIGLMNKHHRKIFIAGERISLHHYLICRCYHNQNNWTRAVTQPTRRFC